MTEQKTFHRAVKWAYIMNWGEKGFSALFTFVLASILGPRDFGTVSMAMIYVLFIQMLLNQGLFAAIIQRKDLQPEHLDSVFWLGQAASLVLVGFSVGFSSWWAAINHLPQLARVISVLSITVPIEGLAMVQRAILQRDMDFKSLAIRSNGSVVAGGVIGLAMALKGFGVWALVGQRVTEDIAALALLWTVGHWRPRWRFSLDHVRDLLGFSTASFVNKVGDFAYGYADAMFMGIFFGPVAVGLFRLAQRLMGQVLDSATSALQTVSFSDFSRLQDRPVELRQSVLTCVRLGSILSVPALAGLAVSSSHLMAVLGDKWAPAGDALTILCIFGITQALSRFTGPLLSAKSKPHLLAVLTWTINVVSIGTLLVVAILLKNASVPRQIMGIALTRLAVGAGIMAPIFLFFLLRYSQTPMKSFLRAIAPSSLAACATSVGVMVLNVSGLLKGLRPTVSLVADVIVGGLVGIGTLLVLDRQLLGEIRALASGGLRREETPENRMVKYEPVAIAAQIEGTQE
jgi:O-antigen/teichoic acid export membrane protein